MAQASGAKCMLEVAFSVVHGVVSGKKVEERIEFDCLIRKIPTTSSKFVQEAQDPQTGKMYYFNTATGATGWALDDVQTIAAEAVTHRFQKTIIDIGNGSISDQCYKIPIFVG